MTFNTNTFFLIRFTFLIKALRLKEERGPNE